MAIAFGMLDPEERDKTGIPLPARAVSSWLISKSIDYFCQCDNSVSVDCKCTFYFVLQVFVIGSDKRVKLSILYPATTGRNFA